MESSKHMLTDGPAKFTGTQNKMKKCRCAKGIYREVWVHKDAKGDERGQRNLNELELIIYMYGIVNKTVREWRDNSNIHSSLYKLAKILSNECDT